MGFKDRLADAARTGITSASTQLANARNAAQAATAAAGAGVAPRLPDDFVSSLVAEAGFPLTGHNVAATTERVASMFRIKGVQFIENIGTPDELEHFKAVTAQPRSGMQNWPQETLDSLVAWNPEVAEHIQDLPAKTRAMLLDSRYNTGGFFNASPDQPLPTMAGWTSAPAVPPPPPEPIAEKHVGLREYLESSGAQPAIRRATRRALASMAVTMVVMTLLGLALASVLSALSVLWDASASVTALFAVLVLATAVGSGAYLAVQRGAAAGLCAAVEEVQLGRAALRTIANTGPIRGVADKRIPLAEAESVLRSAVDIATHSEKPQRGPVGALLFRARRLLYRQVERVTLASLRQQTGQLVDLRSVLELVGARIDGSVIAATRIWARTTTTQVALMVAAIAGGLAAILLISSGR